MRLLFLILLLATPAMLHAQDADKQPANNQGDSKFEQKAEGVLRQPLKDLGIMKEQAPEILLAARANPYGLTDLRNCRDFSRAIGQLDDILGYDVDAVGPDGEPLPGRLAEAGARAVVSSLIPFRGLVREATGAAATDRELRSVLVAGTARRSFLKGYAKARGCKIA